MNLLRLRLLFCAGLFGTGIVLGQTESVSSGAHGFVENRKGQPYSGISIPENRDGAVAGIGEKTTNWTKPDAVAVHYFHHPAAEVETKMVVKVNLGKKVTFKVRVYDPQTLTEPLVEVDGVTVDGTGESQEISLVKYTFPRSDYYRYCLECTSGCTDIIEISNFKHCSASEEQTYKPGYLSSPSVHLNNWSSTIAGAPSGESYDWCYHEVMMPKESDISGTYVMSMGLMNGYMGIQMNGYLPDGRTRHDIIFSIWDKGSTDINPDLPDNLRAKLVDKNVLATNERFGNEGTGMKSFMAGHFWECGKFVQFITNCRSENATYKVIVNGREEERTQENTLVSAWFNAQDGKDWQYIATLRMPGKHKRFDSWYSFLENYDWKTGQIQRRGYYRNGYACDGNGKWYHFNKVEASHTDGALDNGKHKVGARYDYGFGSTDDCTGPNGEKAFVMTTGGFVPAKEKALEVPLNEKNTAVDTISLDVLLQRVDLAVENEKKVKEEETYFKNHQLDKRGWEVISFSSEENSGEGKNGRAALVIDGRDDTYWHSAWKSGSAKTPHEITVDMKASNTLEVVKILMSGGDKRYIKSFDFQISNDGQMWKSVYKDTQVAVDHDAFRFTLPEGEICRYFKMVVNSSTAENGVHVRINEVKVAGVDALAELEKQTRDLLDNMAVVNNDIPLQTTDAGAGGYLYCNAPYSGENTDKSTPENGYNLLDDNIQTHLHTDYSGTDSKDGLDHYLRVDVGEGKGLSDFVFHYETRDNDSPERPEMIVVEGSDAADGSFVLIDTLRNLPNMQAYYYEKRLIADKAYRFLRFRVVDTWGDGTKGGHKYFSMASFGLAVGPLRVVAVRDAYADCREKVEKATNCLQTSLGRTYSDDKIAICDNLKDSYEALLQVYQHRLTVMKDLESLTEKTRLMLNECGEVSSAYEEKTLTSGNLSSNADQNDGGGAKDGGGIPALLDNNTTTYFHSRWGGTEVSEPHYLQVDLEADMLSADDYFKITYTTRKVDNPVYNSPVPVKVVVKGSGDGITYEDIQELTAVADGLPSYQKSEQRWTSKSLAPSKDCRYLRFVVTESNGPNDKKYGGQYFFGISEFGVSILKNRGWAAKPEMFEVTPDLLVSVDNVVTSAETMLQNETSATQLVNASALLQERYAALQLARDASLRFELKVSKYGLAGLYVAKNAEIPAGAKVYVARQLQPGAVVLGPVDGGVVPANTGVIVEARPGTYTFVYTGKEGAKVSSLFEGTLSTVFLKGMEHFSYYLFGAKNGEAGLYKAWLEYDAGGSREGTQGTDAGGYFRVSANKIYLPVPENVAGRLAFVFDSTTGVGDIIAPKEGKMTYDLQGRRIYEIQKSGLYIVDGKKRFIKK